MNTGELQIGPFRLDPERRQLWRAGVPVRIGSRALDILCELVAAEGRLVTKDELLGRVWGGVIVEENALQVHVSQLRKVLDAAGGPSLLATVPGRGYRFAGAIERPPVNGNAGAEVLGPALAGKPSIAVLPFVNLGGEREQDYFADGITEDIITDLSRSRWFLVIARNSSFAFKGQAIEARQLAQKLGVRYLLQGSVRRSGERVRITAQLVDAAEDSQVWADRYDGQLTDIFAVQDEITQRVAGAIEPELLKTEGLRATRRSGGQLSAWELVRQGTWQFHQLTQATHLQARALFRQAVALDPGLAEAHMWLGRADESIVGYGWSDQPEADLREAIQSCLRGVRLDERDPYGHYALAMSYLFSGALEQALQAAERAASLCPSFALAQLGVGMVHLYLGHADLAVQPLTRGLRLNPFDPQNFHWYRCLALAHHFSGAAEDAVRAAVESTRVGPEWRPAWETLAVCLATAGHRAEARSALERLRALVAPPSDVLDQLRLRNPGWARSIAATLAQLDDPAD